MAKWNSDPWRCSEALRHGPTDGRGRCPWCRRKVDTAMPAPHRTEVSDLSWMYERFYDPDWGGLSPAQERARYLMGLG